MNNQTIGGEPEPGKKRGWGEWVAVVFWLVIVLSVFWAVITPKTPEEQLAERSAKIAAEMKAEQARLVEQEARLAKEEAKWDSAVSVTAIELYGAYQANEARAQRDYGNRPLEVTGTVESISLGLGDEPFLELFTGNQFMAAHVELTKEGQAASVDLSRGDEVRLLCEGVSEIGGRPMLKDCAIV